MELGLFKPDLSSPSAPSQEDVNDDASRTASVSQIQKSKLQPSQYSQLVRGVAVRDFLQLGHGLHRHSPLKKMPLEEMQMLYGLSQAVQERDISQFMSHTWRSNPYMKFSALLYLHNTSSAYLAAHVVAFLTFLLMLGLRLGLDWTPPFSTGPLPLVETDSVPWRSTFVCTSTGFLAALFVFLCGHRFRRGAKQELVFFDKICVCQHDEELKEAGIHSFRLVLEKCRSLVMLWDDDYFKRLWCTYEVAAFGQMQQGFHNIQVVPLVLGCFAFIMFVIVAVGVSGMLLTHFGMERLGFFSVFCTWEGYLIAWTIMGTSLVWVPKLYACHLLARGKLEMLEQLDNFHVKDAEVFAESDRKFVNASIQAGFGDLETFDLKVQSQMRKAVENVLGPSWCDLPLKAILFENVICFFCFGYDTILCCEDLEHALRSLVVATGEHFVLNPLYIILTSIFVAWLHRIKCHTACKIALCMLYCPVVGLWWPVWIFCAWRYPMYITVPALLPGAALVGGIALRTRRRQAEAARTKSGRRAEDPVQEHHEEPQGASGLNGV